MWLGIIFGTIALENIVLIAYFPLYFISLKHYRRVTEFAGQKLWPWLIFTLERLGEFKITLYSDDILPPTDKNIFLMMNHQHWCDFVCGFYVAHVRGRLGAMKGFVKESIVYVPVVGTALKAMGFVFLTRNWDVDQRTLDRAFQSLRQGDAFWLFTHPEGSRYDPRKLKYVLPAEAIHVH
uniref:Phospholipid/glycerol acyltransferase domain-containing protein n=1 Tax=Arcella intermedia TaxID=1963864 RepID=A0A6B2LLE1_9EUKA